MDTFWPMIASVVLTVAIVLAFDLHVAQGGVVGLACGLIVPPILRLDLRR